jgi:hypothetical protein
MRAWQRAAALMLDGAPTSELSEQVELALLIDGHRRF